MKQLFTFLLLFIITFSFAQHQDKNWYFGDGTDGIIFDAQNTPVKVSNKYPGVGFEGLAVANDPCSGELLFYTDGITVIDKNHSIMTNGSGLLANYSGSQCVQICKKPGTCSEYYVISNSSWDNTPGSYYYSIVDFSTNPLGQVTVKNQYLNGPNYHQAMRIIPKSNSNNYWLIGHLINSATYHVFEITPTGFVGPVVYNFSNSGRSWAMEYNSNTRKLFNMGTNNLKVTLFDFDPLTGILNNEQQLYTGNLSAWVGNFSPDGSKIYAGLGTSNLYLWQYDFNTSTWTNMNTCCYAHDVKTAPNGITYFINTYNTINPLSQILNANLSAVGNACGYSTITNPGNFNGEVRRFPEFLQVPDPPVANLDTVSMISGGIVISPLLNDYDPQGDTISLTSIVSGPNYGTAVISGNQISYTNTNNSCSVDSIQYLIEDNTCMCDTAYIIIRFSNLNTSLTATPTVQCYGSHNGSASISVFGTPPYQYIWTLPNGAILTNNPISHLSTGNYSVNVIDALGCTSQHYFNISQPTPINVNITTQNAGCGSVFGSAIANVTGGSGIYTYNWNTLPIQTTANIDSLLPGSYQITVTDNHACSAIESAVVASSPPITFTIDQTPASCQSNNGTVTVGHSGGVGGFSYHWNPPNDTTLASIGGLPPGLYSVTAYDLGTGCSQSLSIIVANSAGISAVVTGTQDATCQSGEDGSATVIAVGGTPPHSYLWPNGDTTATTNNLEPGTYTVMVEDYLGCRAYAVATIGYAFASPAIDLGPDTLPCIGTPYTMDAGPGYSSYLWNDNSSNQTLTVSTSGMYSVLVTDSNGCEGFDAINVNFIICASPFPKPLSLSVSEIEIFPNPVGDELTVYFKQKISGETNVTILDLLGKTLQAKKDYSENKNTIKINFRERASGIYFLKIEVENESIILKVIKN